MFTRSLVPACTTFLTLLALSVDFRQEQTPTHSEEAPAVEGDPLAKMAWLAGTWEGDMWGGVFEAYYSTPDGGRILSHSRLLKGGEVSFFEFEVFESRDEAVHLQPYPGGKPAVGLKLTRVDDEERLAVFENPDKDFPTRITYQRVADDNLVITLSDPHGTSDEIERFDLYR